MIPYLLWRVHMRQYVIRRIFSTVPVLLGVTVCVFLMVHLIPGDPARQIVGQDATEEQVRMVRQQLGLDQPLPTQYLSYLGNVLRGHLGNSLRTRGPVSRELSSRFPYTAVLAGGGVVVAGLGGIVLGVVSAVRQYSVIDHACMILALVGVSMPTFWIGIMFVWLFAVHLRWFPPSGVPAAADLLNPAYAKNLVLPIATIAWTVVAMGTRLTRSTMLEVIRQDYVRTARAKGLSERVVIYKHALRNAILPVVTYIGLQFGFLLGGAVVTESIFAWPGMGRYLLTAIQDRDYPVIQSSILVFSFIFVMLNLVVDVVYALIDPRISYN